MTFTFALSSPAGLADWATLATAVIAVLVSIFTVWFSRLSANRTLLQGQMEAYLTAYLDAHRRKQLFHTVAEYQEAKVEAKLVMQLLVARQIGIVDLMHRTHDRRRQVWSYYMTIIRGPLWHDEAKIESYASHGSTLKSVRAAQRVIRVEADIRLHTPMPPRL